jgi:glutathione synthase/RimK-type ligase-like ATP-grasp enzyme
VREPFDLDAPHGHLLRLGAKGPYVLARRFGVPSYDFDFEARLTCSHPVYLPDEVTCLARLGLIADYEHVFRRLREQGLRLVNDPAQSRRANDLSVWAPELGALTPRSLVFEEEVDAERVERELGYPLFVKTVQQTHGHLRELAFVDDRAGLERSVARYRELAHLAGQAIAVRERVSLRLAERAGPSERVPTAWEHRVFVLDGHVVGLGAYWRDAGIERTPEEDRAIRAIALEVQRRLGVPFLAVDVAQRIDGRLVVIETNDAQESGYTTIDPEALWREVIALHDR